jgi:hypothetical protein
MSTTGAAAGLTQALKDITMQWQQVRSHWLDAKADEFREHYLEDLPMLTARTTNAFEEIEALLRKIHKDCE